MSKLKELHDVVKNHPFRINGRGTSDFYNIAKRMIEEYEFRAMRRNPEREDKIKNFVNDFFYDLAHLHEPEKRLKIERGIMEVHKFIEERDFFNVHLRKFCMRCGKEFSTLQNERICKRCISGG